MAESPHTYLRSEGKRSTSRAVTPQQWGALIGGGALAIYGVARRSPLAIALAAGTGTLAWVGGNQRSQTARPSASTTLLVNCSPQEAYQFWRDLENLPRFMNRLESVTALENGRSRWVAVGPMGQPIQWDAEITDERENEYIAWRSLPGSDVQVDGRVQFRQAPAGRGTLISARLEFNSVPGMNTKFANFLRRGASFALRQDLRRLEAILEAGEIPTIEGQSHGPRDAVTGVMRVADPTRPIRSGSSLKDAFSAKRRVA